jgi:hypothetical protein
MSPSSVEHTIPGDYQLRALRSGWRPQRAWHRARLDLVARVLPPPADGLAIDAAAGAGIVTWQFPGAPIVSTDLRQTACAAIRRHTPAARARSLWPLIEVTLDRLRLAPPLAGEQHVSAYHRTSLAAMAEGSGWTVDRLGTFNLVSPIAGTVWPRAGAWATTIEAAVLRAGGPLLFALCTRRD